MIGKVTRGQSMGGLLRYLYGPGRANEHTNPHLVASWLGDDWTTLSALEPVIVDGKPHVAPLATRLDLPLQLRPDAVDRPVWQCSMRVADGDRTLTDAEWAGIARDVVERTGFAPAGDPGACRWVAVRHADDHIHIAVLLARQDGAAVRVFRDWPKVHEAARAAEQRLGLQVVASPDRAATIAPTRAEVEKAARLAGGSRTRVAASTATVARPATPLPARAWLTRQVRVAAAGSVSREEFAEMLQRGGVLVTWRESQRTPGELTGYAVGCPGDVDAAGQQIWFGGSKLSPDLSLPKLRARWAEVTGPDGKPRVPRPRDPLGPEQRLKTLARAERALSRLQARPALGLRDRVAVAEVLTVLARLAEGPRGGALSEWSEVISGLARQPGGRRPRAAGVHPLRGTAAQLSLLGHLLPSEQQHVLLLFAHLARIADAVGWPTEPRAVAPVQERRGSGMYARPRKHGTAEEPAAERDLRRPPPGPARPRGTDRRR